MSQHKIALTNIETLLDDIAATSESQTQMIKYINTAINSGFGHGGVMNKIEDIANANTTILSSIAEKIDNLSGKTDFLAESDLSSVSASSSMTAVSFEAFFAKMETLATEITRVNTTMGNIQDRLDIQDGVLKRLADRIDLETPSSKRPCNTPIATPKLSQHQFVTPKSQQMDVDFILTSPLLTSIWQCIANDEQCTVDKFLVHHMFSKAEKNDVLFTRVIDRLQSISQSCPTSLLMETIISSMEQFKSWSVNTSPTPTRPIQLNKPQTKIPQIDHFKETDGLSSSTSVSILSDLDDIEQVWAEFYTGLNNQPSLYSLERACGTRWRGGPHSATSKAFSRRKTIYQFVVYGILTHGKQAHAIIKWMREFTNKHNLGRQSKVRWFTKNIKKANQEFYGVENIDCADIVANY